MSFQFINWDFGKGAVSSVVMSEDEYKRSPVDGEVKP